MQDDTATPPVHEPARPAIRAAGRRRMPENLLTTIRLDRRTVMSRAVEKLRADLIAHVGGKPSATQASMIEQIVQLKIRLMAMDGAFVQKGENSEHDGRQYLAWSNSLVRLLRQLGLKGAAQQPPSLADYLAAKGPAS